MRNLRPRQVSATFTRSLPLPLADPHTAAKEKPWKGLVQTVLPATHSCHADIREELSALERRKREVGGGHKVIKDGAGGKAGSRGLRARAFIQTVKRKPALPN